MFLFGFFCLKKKIEEKGRFFDKNHGITPFKMPIVLTLLEVHYSGLKSIIYYPEYQKMFLSCFVYSQKKTYKNKVEFLQKPCSNPFAKFPFFLTLLELNFSGVKSILCFPEYKKLFLFWLFWLKKNM